MHIIKEKLAIYSWYWYDVNRIVKHTVSYNGVVKKMFHTIQWFIMLQV